MNTIRMRVDSSRRQFLQAGLASAAMAWGGRCRAEDSSNAEPVAIDGELRSGLMDYYRTTYGEQSPQYRDARPGKNGYTNGRFEPHVAEKLITRMVAQERNIRVLKGFVPVAIEREGALLKSLVLRPFEGGREFTVRAQVFADCMVEGDLMALAKVPYRVGRESRDEYGEPHAGIIFMRPRPSRRVRKPRI